MKEFIEKYFGSETDAYSHEKFNVKDCRVCHATKTLLDGTLKFKVPDSLNVAVDAV